MLFVWNIFRASWVKNFDQIWPGVTGSSHPGHSGHWVWETEIEIALILYFIITTPSRPARPYSLTLQRHVWCAPGYLLSVWAITEDYVDGVLFLSNRRKGSITGWEGKLIKFILQTEVSAGLRAEQPNKGIRRWVACVDPDQL